MCVCIQADKCVLSSVSAKLQEITKKRTHYCQTQTTGIRVPLFRSDLDFDV